MRAVYVSGKDAVEWRDVELPRPGDSDVLLKMRACGICGSDAYYIKMGGIPPRQGNTPLGHEPAAEVVYVGPKVSGVQVGDHVVINPMAFRDGLLGSGGAQGGLSEYVLVQDAKAGLQFRVIPKEIPWEVAALNEPMAVAHHAVNRSGAKSGDAVAVFGAGPIGLGAVISLKARGVAHVVAIDVLERRLETALQVGADAVIHAAEQDVVQELIRLHGASADGVGHGPKAGTDVYIDAAGAPSVIQQALSSAKHLAKLTIVAVHKAPVEVDFGAILATEMDIRLSMGYPTEIFEVTDTLIANWDKYRAIISHRIPFEQALEALDLAKTPGAADKGVVVFP